MNEKEVWLQAKQQLERKISQLYTQIDDLNQELIRTEKLRDAMEEIYVD